MDERGRTTDREGPEREWTVSRLDITRRQVRVRARSAAEAVEAARGVGDDGWHGRGRYDAAYTAEPAEGTDL